MWIVRYQYSNSTVTAGRELPQPARLSRTVPPAPATTIERGLRRTAALLYGTSSDQVLQLTGYNLQSVI